MNRKPLIGACICAVTLLVLGSLTNVVGYQFVKLQLKESSLADVTITDGTEDVWSIDYFTGETTIVTYSPDIEVVNLDLVQATYTQQGLQANLSLQVVGIIENRGRLIDLYGNGTIFDINMVEYGFQLITSEQDYSVSYCNETGQLVYDDEHINLTSSDFSVLGDTLTVWFSLISADELYENLSVTSLYIKANLSNISSGFVYLTDIAPNPPLTIYEVYAPNIGSVGESIQFNASLEPCSGTPPYTYHWNFGDQGTSTALNPTHVYTKAGHYMYTFTITDSIGAIAYHSGFIIIYEFKKTFIFGRYTNWTTEDGFTTIDAARLWTLQFKQFKLELNTPPDQITFSDEWVGLRTKWFIIGMFEVVTLSIMSFNRCQNDLDTHIAVPLSK